MIFDVEIAKYAPPGHGLGYYDSKAVFVSCTSVGDVVRVKKQKEKKNYIIASIVELIKPGPDRVEAPCPHYTMCGGCTLLHLDYEKQLELKKQVLQELFARQQVSIDPEIVPSPSQWKYRHRAQLKSENGVLGFTQLNSHDLTPVHNCMILSDGIKAATERLPLDYRKRQEFLLLESSLNKTVATTVITGKRSRTQPGFPGTIQEDYGFGKLNLRSEDFAQANPWVTGKLIEDLLEEVKGGIKVTELYCGSGTFTIPLAKHVEQVYGYELSEKAVNLAKENVRENGLDNVRLTAGDLTKITFESDVDTIVTDPARIGMGKRIVKLIGASKASKVVYISCNPSTLARDVTNFHSFSDFRLQTIKGYDMFSGSTHMEVMAVLSR